MNKTSVIFGNKIDDTAPMMRLDLKGLPAGAYFVTVVTPQGSHTEKLVVE